MSVPGVGFNSLRKFGNKLRSQIAKALHLSVGCVRIENVGTGGTQEFTLKNTRSIVGTNTGFLLPLLGDDWYWVEVRFQAHEYSNQMWLDQFLLHVCCGRPTQFDKELVLRCEWDFRNPDGSDHAQPHWHFHTPEFGRAAENDFMEFLAAQSKREDGEDFIEFLDEDGERRGSALRADMWRLHLAMATEWHRQGGIGPELEQIGSDDVVAWAAGSVKYLRKQIEYAEGKSKS